MFDEAALRERAAALDPEALAEIYDEYSTKIYSYIYHRIGDVVLAEDLAGDVFIKMLEAVRSDRGWNTSLQGWLFRIAHNLVVDHFRRRGKRETVELDEAWMAAELPSMSFEGVFASNQINQAMRFLTDEQQQVILYKFVDGLTNGEVADIMGKTEGAIKALQHRGLAALREVIGPHVEV